jgi:hypothetical protein
MLLEYLHCFYRAVCLTNFICIDFSLLIPLCFNAQIFQPHKRDGIAKILYTFEIPFGINLVSKHKWRSLE